MKSEKRRVADGGRRSDAKFKQLHSFVSIVALVYTLYPDAVL